MLKRLLPIIILINCFLMAKMFHISISEVTSDGVASIYVDSDENIGGFQFILNDNPEIATVTGAGGGLSAESGFTVSF